MDLRTRMFTTAKLLTFDVAVGGHSLFEAINKYRSLLGTRKGGVFYVGGS